MARRGRSIGTVGDAYVPVPFKEIFQSNLQREKSFDAAEDDIADIETLLATPGGTAGDQDYARELDESFTSGFQSALENTGGNLIETSSFLRKQLGNITQASSIIDSNREAKQKFYEEIDKSDLDPTVANYLKLQSDLEFDAKGGSRARASYSGVPFVDMNAKEVRDQLLALGNKVPETIQFEGVYDLYNRGGQNIYDIQRMIDGISNAEEKEKFVNSLPEGWDAPDTNINGGLPVFSMEKTKSKNINKIFNGIANLAAGDPRIMQYFQQGAMANNALYPDNKTDAITGFNTMIGGIADLIDIPEQAVTKSFPDMSVDTDNDGGDDDGTITPQGYNISGLPSVTPGGDYLTNMAKQGLSYEGVMRSIDDLKIEEGHKIYLQSLVDNAAADLDNTTVNIEEALKKAVGKDNPIFQEYFLKDDGTVNLERVQSNYYRTPFGFNSWEVEETQGMDYQEAAEKLNGILTVKNKLSRTYKELTKGERTKREDFSDALENIATTTPENRNMPVSDTQSGKMNEQARTIITDPNLASKVYKRNSEGEYELTDDAVSIDGTFTITGFDKYAVAESLTDMDATFRTVRVTRKDEGVVEMFEVKVPENTFQNLFTQGDFDLFEEFKDIDKPMKGPDANRINLIANSMNAATDLPGLESRIQDQISRALNIDPSEVDVDTRITKTGQGFAININDISIAGQPVLAEPISTTDPDANAAFDTINSEGLLDAIIQTLFGEQN